MTSDELTDGRGRSFAETLSDPLSQSEVTAAPQPDNENTVQPDPKMSAVQTVEVARPADVITISDADNFVARESRLSQTDVPAVRLPIDQNLSLTAPASPMDQTLTITPTSEVGASGDTARPVPTSELYVTTEDAPDLRVLPATAAAADAVPQTPAIATVLADAKTVKADVPHSAAKTPAPAIDETDALTSKADNADSPTLSTRAADTADYRALAQSSTGPNDRMKLADAPTLVTSPLTSSDAPVPAKLSPVMTALPTLSPLTGMSDRLAATIMQTTQAQPTVTLDKLPQTVVAIALTARSATLQIDPPELGRIQLDYQFDSQGRTVVTLTPESDAARAALMDRMASIVAALEQGSDKPIDVKLGDARDFGSEFDQTSQDDRGSGSNTKDGAKSATSDHAPLHDSQRFMRAPTGEAERLHILV